jgi:Plavaka transposase
MPSFTSAHTLYERIELLPDGGPRWRQQQIVPQYGDPIGPVSLYYRDPMEAISHLLSHPSLAPHLEFQPKRVWSDASKKLRIYSEMTHGEWWWDVQVRTNVMLMWLSSFLNRAQL